MGIPFKGRLFFARHKAALQLETPLGSPRQGLVIGPIHSADIALGRHVQPDRLGHCVDKKGLQILGSHFFVQEILGQEIGLFVVLVN